MSVIIEKIFITMPHKEAVRMLCEYDDRLKTLKKQGAKKGGERDIDRQLTAVSEEAMNYLNQFTRDELLILLGIASVNEKQFAQ